MRVPSSWLRDFAPIEAPAEELATVLSELGLVVEGMERVGEGLGDIVVAKVLSTAPHPDADRVQLVEVDRGDGAVTQVVCGAFNFGPGDLLPFAPVGARLPGGMEIGRRKVRGRWSEGMLCSGAELALSDDHDGILVLPDGLAAGMPLTEALGITPDVVFDLDVTPNRPDALSILGVARDVAAKLGVPLDLPPASLPGPVADGGGVVPTVVVDAPDLCPRFTATLLTGVVVGPSPGWMASRLTLAGMRPINNVVDVSNYVMLELGQPNHPYDLDLLAGKGLSVRRAVEGEVLVTLDGTERRLSAEDCVIGDAEGAGVGIGGIMGGASTEIADTTATVLLEAAYFDPMAIARTSKRLGLRTEASVRFERGTDPENIERALARFCQLAADVAGAAVAGSLIDVSAPRPPRSRARVRTAKVNALLGSSLTPQQVQGYLEPIGFVCEPLGEGDFDVTIPSWRPDSEREADVVEEVARHHGYGNIVRTLPAVTRVGGLTDVQRGRRKAREALVGAGLSEAWSTSLVAPADLARAGLGTDAVEVENPLAQEESVLRTSLLPGLLRAVVTNANRRYPDVRLFEIGKVFLPLADGARLPDEPELVGAALSGADAAAAKRVLDTLVGALRVDRVALSPASPAGLHPSRSAGVSASGTAVGVVGEVDPGVLEAHGLDGPVGWFELDLGALLAAPKRSGDYRPVSRYPSADFDLAVVVAADVPAARVAEAIERAAGELLEDLWLFDVFRGPQLGEGRRSLAYRVRVAAPDRTLTEDELAALRESCIAAVSAVGGTLRT